MLCGIEGNPLTLAASRSVECFRATLRALKVRSASRPESMVVVDTLTYTGTPATVKILSVLGSQAHVAFIPPHYVWRTDYDGSNILYDRRGVPLI